MKSIFPVNIPGKEIMKTVAAALPLATMISLGGMYIDSFSVKDNEHVIQTKNGVPVRVFVGFKIGTSQEDIEKRLDELRETWKGTEYEKVEWIYSPGRHFFTPIVGGHKHFPGYPVLWNGNADNITTGDMKPIYSEVSAFVKVDDPLSVLLRCLDIGNARSKIDGILDADNRNILPKYSLVDMVRTEKRDLEELPWRDEISLENLDTTLQPEDTGEAGSKDETIFTTSFYKVQEMTGGQTKMIQDTIDQSRPKLKGIGWDVMDLIYPRFGFVTSVETAINDNMKATLDKRSGATTSIGDRIAKSIEGNMRQRVTEILSDAYKQCQTIRGAADALNVATYATSYNQNAEFFAFREALNAMALSVDSRFTLVVSGEENALTRALNGKLQTDKILQDLEKGYTK